MLARRIITVVSPDEAFGDQLATTLRSVVETVELESSVNALAARGADEPRTSLCVLHLAGEPARAPSELLERLKCSTIIVVPRSNLAGVVELMQASHFVVAIVIAEEIDPHRLCAMVTRILADDIFGLDKVMAPGTQIHSQVVCDYQDKLRCISLVGSFVAQIGAVGRSQQIEQCIDEMMMNALYDAPVDEQGKHIFAGVATKQRIGYRTEQSVEVQYACDDKRFAISVLDAFGSLPRATVLQTLHKCLHSDQPIDRKAGGAGLGLYLLVNLATAVYFNLSLGVATEVTCIFDLEPPSTELAELGFFVQIQRAGLASPAHRVPTAALRRRRVLRALGVMAAAAVVLIGVTTLRRIFGPAEKAEITITTIPKGATIAVEGRTMGTTTGGTLVIRELDSDRAYRVVARLDGHDVKRVVVQPHAGANAITLELAAVASVELDSQPSSAAIEIDGHTMGTTPLTLTSLEPGSTVSIAFASPGYRTKTARLEVPRRGDRRRLVQPLELADNIVRVRFVSNPPGAAIVRTGEPAGSDRTYTPAELFVEANTIQRYMLTMPKHVPLVIEPFTPARGEELVKGGDLVEE